MLEHNTLPRAAVAALALLSIALPEARAEDRGTLSLVLENDFFAGFDQDYTNGFKANYVEPPGSGQRLARRLLGAGPDDESRFSYGAGQSIFTPEEFAAPIPPPTEHPYAGWLYGEAAVVVERSSGPVDILAVDLGIVGPAALGEQSQKLFHSIIGYREPQGWDFQLRNEPGIMASFDRIWRAASLGRGRLSADLSPHLGASAGNVLTEARAGARVRFGSELASHGGQARIRPSLPSGGFHGEADGFAWHIFAGAQGRAIARDIFLDGNSFVDSASVEKNNFVGEFEAGFSLRLGRAALSYTHVWRTKEYETQPAPHAFGSLAVSFNL